MQKRMEKQAGVCRERRDRHDEVRSVQKTADRTILRPSTQPLRIKGKIEKSHVNKSLQIPATGSMLGLRDSGSEVTSGPGKHQDKKETVPGKGGRRAGPVRSAQGNPETTFGAEKKITTIRKS